jgi:hypothetical protein
MKSPIIFHESKNVKNVPYSRPCGAYCLFGEMRRFTKGVFAKFLSRSDKQKSPKFPSPKFHRYDRL